MIDIEIQISISERSSGWATNYSNSSSSNINNSIEKRKKLLEKETLETEELPLLLQSGVLLCRFSLGAKLFSIPALSLKVHQPAPTFQWHCLVPTPHRNTPCQEKQHQVNIYQYINISIYQYINISIYQYINTRHEGGASRTEEVFQTGQK